MKICPQCGKAYDVVSEVCQNDRTPLISVDTANDPMLGQLLDGRYRLIRKIGEGGMGAIYRAVHTEIVRTCAIKLLTGVSPGKDDAIARFKREARNSCRIDNVHAVTVYDFGQTNEGLLFLAMEFIDGKPLSRVIAEHRVLPIERVVHITNQIAEALSAAHALPMIHRDLKPDNIMITHKGSNTDFVKVLDFGIAKALADENSENLTKTGFVLGTPVYMSPEQLLGEELDPRSDIYSLAIIVYEMLSGRLPFEGDNLQAVMMKRVMSQPVSLRVVAPSLSESVEQAVMAGLERNRDTRTSTVEAFAADLSRVLHGGGTQIMGGVITGPLASTTDARTSVQWSGSQTNLDSSPAFTGQSERSTSSGRTDAQTWAPTEVGPALTQPQRQDPTPLPQTRVQPPPETATLAPPVSQPLPLTARQVETRPQQSAGKWIALAGVVLLVVIGAILYLILKPAPAGSGFTLVVKGAPAGSQVFVNETRRDAVAADGTLRITGVDPGPVNVRVSHEGFADFTATLTGSKGEVQSCEAQLLPGIDYGGAMVPVPAGEFEMGDNNHEPDERPAHPVRLPSYYIDKYEVTNAQYKKFCDETHHAYPPNPPFDQNYFTAKPDDPVLGVPFEDALAYASWAGKRLPTEEEWEKAASWDPVARKKRTYPWGDEFTPDRANIATGHPLPVTEATKDLSFYGVVDMAGNAWEWVNAPYKPYEGNKTPNPDYDKDERVMRGGTFLSGGSRDAARTSYRDHLPRVFPPGRSTSVGLRCVVSADDPRINALVRSTGK